MTSGKWFAGLTWLEKVKNIPEPPKDPDKKKD